MNQRGTLKPFRPDWQNMVNQFKARPLMLIGFGAALAGAFYMLAFPMSPAWLTYNAAVFLLKNRQIMDLVFFFAVFGAFFTGGLAGLFILKRGKKHDTSSPNPANRAQ